MKNNFQKILLLVSAVFFMLSFFAFLFLYRQIDSNNKKAENGMAIWAEEDIKRWEIKNLDNSLEKITDDNILLESHFAKSSNIVPFLNTIEKLAPSAGVFIEIDSVNIKTDNTGLLVGLKVAGRFEGIYKFLTLLENSPYELDFLSMDIHKLSTGAVVEKGKKTAASQWEGVFKIQLLSFVF